MRRLLLPLAAAAVLAAPAAAAPARTTLKITAGPGAMLAYSMKALTAKAGVVTIAMTNKGVLPHDVGIKGNGVSAKGKVVAKGGVSTVTATLKPGRYTFYCSVPGHEAAGMKGTLTVR